MMTRTEKLKEAQGWVKRNLEYTKRVIALLSCWSPRIQPALSARFGK